jgi:excisionase family DNA binding protein
MNSKSQRLTMLTINEAAERFRGLTAYRIRALIKSGVLPYISAGKKYLVCEQILREYILNQGVPRGNISPQDTPRR